MPHENLNPPSLARAIGFAHATVTPADGHTVHLGGQTAMDSDGVIVTGGIVEQFRQAFGNLLTALAATGGTPEDLVSVTIISPTSRTTRPMGGRSAGSGATWPAPTTRPWPVSGSPDCGNPRH